MLALRNGLQAVFPKGVLYGIAVQHPLLSGRTEERNEKSLICVSGIRLPFDEEEGHALSRAQKLLRLPHGVLRDSYVVRRSLDARRRSDIRFVYTVGVETAEFDEAEWVRRLRSPQVTLRAPAQLTQTRGDAPLPPGRPVVAGFGPAGMFCALLLAQGGYRPIVLERGADVDKRVAAVEDFWKHGRLSPQTNVQFGEGGAGTFSDGKLTTRIGDARCDWVLRELVRFGAPAEILRNPKPHIGTDRLRAVVKNLRQEVVRSGGEVRFLTPLTGLRVCSGRIAGIVTPQDEIETGVLVAALGHSARDSFHMLLEAGVEMTAKSFSVGVRIEHLQSAVDKALYGGFAGHPRLPRGEYQLSQKVGEGGRGVYTFCMCPGGYVVPSSSEPETVVVNGMSEFLRDGPNANSALVCGVGPGDFGSGPLDGVRFQQELEHRAFLLGGGDYRAPVQTAGRFLGGKPGADFGAVASSYALGVKEADFTALFPDWLCGMLKTGLTAFGRKQQGFDCADAVLTGVETRTSSPVRIPRGEGLCSNIGGLYPCGEGAGWAGGILSAAVDGIRVAQEIMALYRPL